MSQPLLTTQEVAAILKLKACKTVRGLVKAGKLRRVIVGERSVRFREEDVRAYVEGLTCHSSDEAGSGITNSSSVASAIAAPHARRKRRKPASSSRENVIEFPWEG